LVDSRPLVPLCCAIGCDMSSSVEVLVLGGGLIGLAIGLELQRQGAQVTILSRNGAEAAGYAAAGMLAPQAECLDPGPMLDLCLRSRECYVDWAAQLAEMTGLDIGYWPCGILSPLYGEPEAAPPSTPESPAHWLDRKTIHEFQTGLGDDVIGGWWYPKDGQVDNRRKLLRVLNLAAKQAGVDYRNDVEIYQLKTEAGQISEVLTDHGTFRSDHYVLATGAWSGRLLSVPVYPRKGQVMEVRAPLGQPLQQVLFGENIYLVPRRDGLITIGATVEDVDFLPSNTPVGLCWLLNEAMRLYPVLKEFPIDDTWWGYRPATPDEMPILGPSPYGNLTLAMGHYRNGVLLTPITAQLIADWVLRQVADPLLGAFRWDRF
jgi:glycine oxidase